MRWILAIAVAVALAFGGAGTVHAAVVRVSPEKMVLNDTGRWQVLLKVWFLDGSWTWGYLRWSGVQSQIDWGNAVVCCLQGNGTGFQPEPKLNLIGSRIEIVGTPTQSSQ
jgi:hypothetical protein